MSLVPIILAILAGLFTTVETTINAQLGKNISPEIATLHSLIVGMLFMLIVSLYSGKMPMYTKITTVSPIWLIGGIFGAFIIYFSSRAIPEIGISNTLILILSGQLVSGLVIDVLYNNMIISTRKVVGLALFLVGTIMFLKE